MKNYLYVFVIISFISCRTKKYTNEIIVNNYPDLLNIIIDENSIKNDSIYFTVENNSDENYYFPLVINKYQCTEKIMYVDFEINTEIIVNTQIDKDLNFPYFGKPLVNIDRKKETDRNLKVVNFRKINSIKSKEKLKFKIPIPPHYYDLMKNPNKYLDKKEVNYFGIQICAELNPELNPKVITDSLEQKGFRLYRKKINSNKINFVLKDSI